MVDRILCIGQSGRVYRYYECESKIFCEPAPTNIVDRILCIGQGGFIDTLNVNQRFFVNPPLQVL